MAVALDQTQELIEAAIRSEAIGITPTTKRTYASVMRSFLQFTGKDDGWSAQDLKTYFANELEQGRSRSYVRWQFYPIKALFSYREMQMPVKLRIIPTAKWSEIRAPALDFDEVAAFIETAHKGLISAADTALVCACTVWGFRRVEMGQFTVEGDLVSVSAAKGGPQRVHLIPEQLIPVLQGHEQRDARYVGDRFPIISRLARVKHRDGMGWHSIRRSVSTALTENGVPDPTLKAFMGWSNGGSSNMPSRYYRPRAREVDQIVYNVHPFLAMW
jgi:integrase